MPHNYSPELNTNDIHENVTAYINAGGRGTRLNTVLVPHPDFGVIKALLEVGEPPVALIDHHIAKMAQAAMRNIVISAGDVDIVADYITHFYDKDPRVNATSSTSKKGNGGDLLTDVQEHPELFADRILVTNADTVLDLDEHDFLSFHESTGSPVSIALTRQKKVPNQNAFYVNQQGKVIYSKESQTNLQTERQASRATMWRGSSTGAVIVETDFVKDFTKHSGAGEISLYRDIIGEAVLEGAVAGYDNGRKFFMDLGTVSTWLAAQDPDVLNPHLFRRS